jgi:hypothetical protein
MWCAYCILVMAIYWIFECVPLAITSLIPVVILPLTGKISIPLTNQSSAFFMPTPFPLHLTNRRTAFWKLVFRLFLPPIRRLGGNHFNQPNKGEGPETRPSPHSDNYRIRDQLYGKEYPCHAIQMTAFLKLFASSAIHIIRRVAI